LKRQSDIRTGFLTFSNFSSSYSGSNLAIASNKLFAYEEDQTVSFNVIKKIRTSYLLHGRGNVDAK